MKWIVGLSFREGDITPATMAAWAGPAAELCLVHVIDRARLRFADADAREQMTVGATRALEEAAQRAGLDPARTELVVATEGAPETVLAQLARDREVDGIISSRRRETSVMQLGRTVRRLLRVLPVPVMVVPPQMTADAVGDGPVLLAGDGRHDASHANLFSTRLGESIDRPVEMVHVYPERFDPGPSPLPLSYLEGMYSKFQQQNREKLQRWQSAYGLEGLPLHETDGPVVGGILAVGRDVSACAIVCASRELTPTERLFNSSVGSQLATVAACPIVVVPIERKS